MWLFGGRSGKRDSRALVPLELSEQSIIPNGNVFENAVTAELAIKGVDPHTIRTLFNTVYLKYKIEYINKQFNAALEVARKQGVLIKQEKLAEFASTLKRVLVEDIKKHHYTGTTREDKALQFALISLVRHQVSNLYATTRDFYFPNATK